MTPALIACVVLYVVGLASNHVGLAALAVAVYVGLIWRHANRRYGP